MMSDAGERITLSILPKNKQFLVQRDNLYRRGTVRFGRAFICVKRAATFGGEKSAAM